MRLGGDFRWSADVRVDNVSLPLWLDMLGDGERLVGSTMMVDIQRAVEAQGLWPSGGSVSVGSGAEFAHQAQLDACCRFQATEILASVNGVVDSVMASVEPCAERSGTCRAHRAKGGGWPLPQGPIGGVGS